MALIIPNVIANGDVEDATVVMENFDYIAAHAPSGPGTTTVNNVPAWGDVTGTGLVDAGVSITELIRGGGTTVVDNVATWNDTTGSALTDSGIPIASLVPGAATVSTPANPTETTSMIGVMMGFAGTVTPTRSGKVMVMMTMQTLIGGDTSTVQMRYGTGAAPVNGAALTGTVASPTALGVLQFMTLPLVALITGLTIGVPVWLDVSVTSTSGGSVGVVLGHIVALEA
jgi:hypothetical protein